jgi:hypothetical protein
MMNQHLSELSMFLVFYVLLLAMLWLAARWLVMPLDDLSFKRPGEIFIHFIEGEFGMLKFVLVLPEKSATDVVSRELSFKVGEDVFDLVLDGNTLETEELSGEDDSEVVGTLVDVDDAGNKSLPREFSFVLVDTLAPPQPGELGVRVTGEE